MPLDFRTPDTPPRVSARTSPVHGRGVFADEPIAAGTVILEYLGERIGPDEARRREEASPGLTYILWYDDATFLDGAVVGNDSRYINHSCAPNCGVLRRAGRAFVIALADIPPGQELAFDYCFHPDEERVPCRCGAPDCRGFLNAAAPAPDPIQAA